MPIFNYKAKDLNGADVKGEMNAVSSESVATRLSEKGFTPIFILEQEESASDSLEKFLSRFQTIKSEEMIVFVRQLSSVLAAGVPLLESLDAVYEQVQSPKFKEIILDIRRSIEGGSSFSEALASHKAFSSLFVSMVRSGEKAGILGDVLERLANLLERDYDNAQKIKSAMRYPIMVILALVVAFVVIITFVIPQFSTLYSSFKTELPLPTRILLGLNYTLVHYWYFILGGLGITGYGIKRFLDTDIGRLTKDKFAISVIIFGPLIKKLILARFSRMLAAMLKSGIPIIEALTISRDTVENKILSDVITNVKEQVIRGSGLAEPMRASKAFPPLAVQMVAIGEKSGSIESMLSKVADYFDRDTDYTIRNLTPLIEPLLILVLAFMVVLLALGVFLPMWDMVKFIKN